MHGRAHRNLSRQKKQKRPKKRRARDQVIGIYTTACAAATATCDEYLKGPYLWPTQRPGMTKEEMKDARMAQERIIHIFIEMDAAAWSVCDDYIRRVNPEEHKQVEPQDEDETDGGKSSNDSAATEGSSSTGTSSYIDT